MVLGCNRASSRFVFSGVPNSLSGRRRRRRGLAGPCPHPQLGRHRTDGGTGTVV